MKIKKFIKIKRIRQIEFNLKIQNLEIFLNLNPLLKIKVMMYYRQR
jgi:hypothetical protein